MRHRDPLSEQCWRSQQRFPTISRNWTRSPPPRTTPSIYRSLARLHRMRIPMLPVCASACCQSIRAKEQVAIHSFFLVGAASCLHVQDGMKRTLVVLALIALAGLAIWFPRILTARVKSNPRAQPVAMTSCVDRYNSLLKHAKSALAAGDRSSTVKLLQRAKSLITVCPALQDPQSSTSIISF